MPNMDSYIYFGINNVNGKGTLLLNIAFQVSCTSPACVTRTDVQSHSFALEPRRRSCME